MAIVSKKDALKSINKKLLRLNAEDNVTRVAKREDELTPFPPPGSNKVVEKR